MNPPLPRRFFFLLLVFGVLVGTLFAAATFFFAERSVERISAYFILTMGTCVLMCAIGLALTHRGIDQHFAARENWNGADTAIETPPAAEPQQAVLKPEAQTNSSATVKANSQCVVSATN